MTSTEPTTQPLKKDTVEVVKELCSDLEELPQDDGPKPVVAIRYTKEFTITMNYFRRILSLNEISLRALKLTAMVIKLNSSNYTAWQFRRKCIFDLKQDLYQELEYTASIARKSPKNYQLWWHRREIIFKILENEKNSDVKDKKWDPDSEKPLIRDILKEDGKNYHAWSHLHWLLKTFKNFNSELEYIEELLSKDQRNNSVWNHRYFIISHTTKWDYKTIIQEIEFTRKYIGKLVENESVWYYYTTIVLEKLRDLTNKTNFTIDDKKENENENEKKENIKILKWKELRNNEIEYMSKVVSLHPFAYRAVLFYVDLLCDNYNIFNGRNVKDCIYSLEDIENGKQMCCELEVKVDRIRHNYYRHIIDNKIEPMLKDLKSKMNG